MYVNFVLKKKTKKQTNRQQQQQQQKKKKNAKAPIAGAALSSIDKFLDYEIFNSSQENIRKLMSDLSYHVTHVKFEATDTVGDEVVLMKIIDSIKTCVSCSYGSYLSDKMLCQMIETCFSMCFQMRLSELLRKYSEKILISIIQVVMSKMNTLNVDDLHADQPQHPQNVIDRNVAREIQSESDVGRVDSEIKADASSLSFEGMLLFDFSYIRYFFEFLFLFLFLF